MTDATRGDPARTARALALACHPGPCVAVTAFAALLALAAGDGPGVSALLAAAVLCGQLLIGWSNDRLDARRDRSVGREDKPLAAGVLASRPVEVAAAVAAVLVIALSLLLGLPAGLLHLGAVASGMAYNVWLKATWWSWLPYAVSFGALPGVATLAGPGRPAPAAWLVVAGALLGVVAHLLNALPDLEDDVRTGIRGFPQRLGATASLAVAALLLLAGSVAIVLGPPGDPRPVGWAGLAVDVLAAAAGLAWQYRRPPSRLSFYGLILVVAVNLALLVTAGRLSAR